MRQLGDRLDTYAPLRHARPPDSLLTKTCNRFFDPTVHDEESIVELRKIHKAIDEATVCAYGWADRVAEVAAGGVEAVVEPVEQVVQP